MKPSTRWTHRAAGAGMLGIIWSWTLGTFTFAAHRQMSSTFYVVLGLSLATFAVAAAWEALR